MKKGDIKLIIFDFDGTLVDSKEFHKNGLINSLKKENVKINKRKIDKFLGKKISEILKGFHITKRSKIERILEDINYEKSRNIKKVKFIGKSKELIKRLNDYKLAIISNAETDFIEKVLKKEKMRKYFKGVLGAEKFKNKASAIKNLMKKFKIKKDETIFIGDRYSDIENGEKVGIITVAVSNKYSWSTKSHLLDKNPDYLIYNIEDIEKIIYY